MPETTTKREALHRLADELPEDELHAAERYLQFLREKGDPLLRALMNAPYDDEPETKEERQAVAEARAEADRGELIPHEEVKRRWGIGS